MIFYLNFYISTIIHYILGYLQWSQKKSGLPQIKLGLSQKKNLDFFLEIFLFKNNVFLLANNIKCNFEKLEA